MLRAHLPRTLFATVVAFTALTVLPSPALAQTTTPKPALEEAVFAGGCFWCMEEAFEKINGVNTVESGYTGGKTPDPDYNSVSSGRTGHVEVIRVRYDPSQVNYENLLKAFWANIDPTVSNRQFCDVGEQYRSAIFYVDEKQRELAQKSKQDLEKIGKFKRIYTTVEPAQRFYMAEEYHQDFYKKNPLRYKFYKTSCGREDRLNEVWAYQPGKR